MIDWTKSIRRRDTKREARKVAVLEGRGGVIMAWRMAPQVTTLGVVIDGPWTVGGYNNMKEVEAHFENVQREPRRIYVNEYVTSQTPEPVLSTVCNPRRSDCSGASRIVEFVEVMEENANVG